MKAFKGEQDLINKIQINQQNPRSDQQNPRSDQQNPNHTEQK
ncbi:hypothetical protein ACSL78_001809 [Campylobacter jejuni]